MEPSLDGAAAAAGPASALAAQQQHTQLDQNNKENDVDTAEFLKSIRELSDKRDREDLERYQKLEEEVARSRAERAQKKLDFMHEADGWVRWAERTRSISPKKPYSSNDLPSLKASKAANVADTPPPLSSSIAPPTSTSTSTSTATMEGMQAGPPSPTKDTPEFKGFGSIKRASASSTTSASGEAGKPAQSASSLARSGTLSWQRRPQSRGGSRPASVIGGQENGHVRDTSTEQAEPSRDQIAASLGSRDPSFFRQTADRGVGSAAYRRSKDEAPISDLGSGRRGLPGLSQEKFGDYAKPASPARPESVVSEAFSTPSARDSGSSSARFSGTSGSRSSKPDLKSLLAEDQAQQEASPSSDPHSSAGGDSGNLGRTPTMSSSQSRLANATERPSSPTKGMGGFVQSAMMKRSDSVNKRWSAQPNAAPSLSRQNSIASARSGYGGLQGSYSMPKLDPTINSRESSHESTSRPTSSSSNDLSALAQLEGKDSEGFVKPALPRHHSRSKSVVSNYAVNTSEDSTTSPPSSPSKRFSPTKSSWIESALTKPDSPNPSTAAPARNSQPSWMANIAKQKAERASGDLTPRTGTPKPAEESSRPSSPTKLSGGAPFGQGLLKRSESRDLQLPSRSGTPVSSMARQGALTPKPDSKEEAVSSSKAHATTSIPARDAAAGASSPSPQLQSSREPLQPLPVMSTAPEPAESTMPEPATTSNETVESIGTTPAPKPKPTITASKPDIATKPQTDFRGTLRSRPAPETKSGETPEFLAKFGHLRKAATEKYVAPDTFGNNIKRGKAELAKTDGPVKTLRRDELKESLLAKKEDWKKAKNEGRELPGAVHERKVSGTSVTPSKPEALARRDLLGRSESGRLAASPEKPKEATPEALSRQKSLREKSKVEPPRLVKEASEPVGRPATTQPEPLALKGKSTTLPAPADPPLESLSKQTSAPAAVPSETSRLAARFNPGLANILARGPPSGSNKPSRSESPANADRTPAASGVAGESGKDGPLQDMRKGRAKGPKKRKGGAGEETKEEKVEEPVTMSSATSEVSPTMSEEKEEEVPAVPSASKPRAPPGSAASLMMASLRGRTEAQEPASKSDAPPTPKQPTISSTKQEQQNPVSKPAALSTPAKSPALPAKPTQTPQTAKKANVPEFSGFGSMKKSQPAAQPDDNKENTNSPLPSVRNVASFWTRQTSPAKKAEAPPQIQLLSRRDEEAALRSANLLSTSPSRPGSSKGGLGISVEKTAVGDGGSGVATPPSSAGLPPKPGKPSRVVSGQLREASPNKASATTPTPREPRTHAERLLAEYFGSVPVCDTISSIDVNGVIASAKISAGEDLKTLRRSTQIVLPDGTLKPLPQQEEYTLFSHEVYILSQTCVGPTGLKKTQVYIWSGISAPQATTSQAQNLARRLSRGGGSLPVRTFAQGKEDTAFLSAIGGILITRHGAREGAKKQFALCGRAHMGQVVFDEVDFGIESLCSGFVYLISYPVTLQQTKMYLWKGSAASTEEIGAARLVAMDLSSTGEIIEVDDGAEFASFLKIFGAETKKGDVPKSSPSIWGRKADHPGSADVRLWRIQEEEQKTGLFVGMFKRRPSWHSSGTSSRSPSADGRDNGVAGAKIEAKAILPFTQADLEVEGLYVLDAYGSVYVLVGPLFASAVREKRNRMFGQGVAFAREYLRTAHRQGAEGGGRPGVVLHGTPDTLKHVFRHWDEGRGLWGTAGLMAGSRSGSHEDDKPVVLSLDEIVEALTASS
ncbi:hypothetical protein LTR78_009111 [Recurvomyces mirabilis]|uniref:DUF4045 domain-containing protein n=1 Tax=Recurvomyces mirabilis TaxID=574656 RepID=A0AAE0TNU4_9PEZI|nr:hypothetical protein LTR78_009111 [Recurvomyces mirabilis]KAK5161051.1 hypothetical protein LTS14_000845 [Recurvomyces mirabilis]